MIERQGLSLVAGGAAHIRTTRPKLMKTRTGIAPGGSSCFATILTDRFLQIPIGLTKPARIPCPKKPHQQNTQVLEKQRVLAKLTQLGAAPTSQPVQSMETFPNPNPDRDYLIHMQIPEFTYLCPKTG